MHSLHTHSTHVVFFLNITLPSSYHKSVSFLHGTTEQQQTKQKKLFSDELSDTDHDNNVTTKNMWQRKEIVRISSSSFKCVGISNQVGGLKSSGNTKVSPYSLSFFL